MYSVVNGYLCTCSCDVAKAKRGVDPHPKTDDTQNPAKPDTKDGVVRDDQAVTYGGSLSAPTATSATVVTATSASQSSAQVNTQTVNLLV